jgi:cation diffusion facilitator CzcD-associated flavoprotein CzcO
MSVEHGDVLIVGASLSGIGAGYHLQVDFPDKAYAILKARDCIGGTWDLFRYPRVRSDRACRARRRWPARSGRSGLCQRLARDQTGSTSRP